MTESVLNRLQTLAAAAKYDVSCSSSGTVRRNNGAGVGNTVGGIGICQLCRRRALHSATEGDADQQVHV